jgi:hypothetical protein
VTGGSILPERPFKCRSIEHLDAKAQSRKGKLDNFPNLYSLLHIFAPSRLCVEIFAGVYRRASAADTVV